MNFLEVSASLSESKSPNGYHKTHRRSGLVVGAWTLTNNTKHRRVFSWNHRSLFHPYLERAVPSGPCGFSFRLFLSASIPVSQLGVWPFIRLSVLWVVFDWSRDAALEITALEAVVLSKNKRNEYGQGSYQWKYSMDESRNAPVIFWSVFHGKFSPRVSLVQQAFSLGRFLQFGWPSCRHFDWIHQTDFPYPVIYSNKFLELSDICSSHYWYLLAYFVSYHWSWN